MSFLVLIFSVIGTVVFQIRPKMQSFDILFAVIMDKLLNKEPNYQWFETKWHTYDVTVMHIEYLPPAPRVTWQIASNATSDG